MVKGMKKIRYSNFEMIEDVIKNIDFNYNPIRENLESYWVETVGEKIKTMAKVLDFSADNVLTIVCSDSYVANELYLEKSKLLEFMNIKAQETGIKIEDIKFDYKKWKETNDE